MSTPPVAQIAQSSSNEQLLTANEVATRIKLSVGWVNDHASGRRRPVLPSVKLGKAVRFRQSDINRFIEEGLRNAT